MKAIRTIHENPEYVEWVVLMEDGSIATSGSPQLFADGCTLESMKDYWHGLGHVFNPTDLPIEVVTVEILVKEDQALIQEMKEATIQIENERKWIMKMLPSVQWDDKIYIDQFYIMYNGKPHRVRFNYENNIWTRTTSGRQERKLRSIEFIHKEKVGPGQNKEHHIECTYERAKELIKMATKRITKVRHIHNADVKYEVDVMLNSKYPRGMFILMEAEIVNMDQEIFIPERIQEAIEREVTGDKEYDNFSLSIAIDPGIDN